eukprot:CAMPEP_0117445490 /NCGR_PEP_ID=MMETSP0759-20121206/5825_1 /TAXON_ID=63605 /ORGANISM="Percolomonas cosmopolitus, Strain WS" /LENGTH=421 /DNA_ID=CAMNT_0005237673 /DNA_START=8 /DNA_END=1273 /DNA_ORIENTATION=-
MPSNLFLTSQLDSPFPLRKSSSYQELFQSRDLFRNTKEFQKSCFALKAIERNQDPDGHAPSASQAHFIYLHQREKLTLPPKSCFLRQDASEGFTPTIIASAEATTCCILGIQTQVGSLLHEKRQNSSTHGFISMAHIDGSDNQLRKDEKCAVRQMLGDAVRHSTLMVQEAIGQSSNTEQFHNHPIDIHLFLTGGMCDQDEAGEQIVTDIFDSLRTFILEASSKESTWSGFTLRFHLEVFSVLEWNTQSNGFPLCTSMGFYLHDFHCQKNSLGRHAPYLAFPLSGLSFDLMGNEYNVRGVRGMTGNGLLQEIFSQSHDCIQIGPYDYQAIPPLRLMQFLTLSEDVFLQYLSTSPDYESDLFVPSMKRFFYFMLEHPNAEEYFRERNVHFALNASPVVDVAELEQRQNIKSSHRQHSGLEKQQ